MKNAQREPVTPPPKPSAQLPRSQSLLAGEAVVGAEDSITPNRRLIPSETVVTRGSFEILLGVRLAPAPGSRDPRNNERLREVWTSLSVSPFRGGDALRSLARKRDPCGGSLNSRLPPVANTPNIS